MVRKKELVRQLEDMRAYNVRRQQDAARLERDNAHLRQSVAETKAKADSLEARLKTLDRALIRAGVAYDPFAFVALPWQAEPGDVEASIGRLREERDLYRNAFILLAHTEAVRSAASPKEVARARKAHDKAGAPRIAYDDTTGMTRLLYPAPPEKSPLELGA